MLDWYDCNSFLNYIVLTNAIAGVNMDFKDYEKLLFSYNLTR